ERRCPEGKWLLITNLKSFPRVLLQSQHLLCSQHCAPLEDDHGNTNSNHVEIFLLKNVCQNVQKERKERILPMKIPTFWLLC
uniref:Uncharacterized protein n=1 Tax=Sus scrofa TaxID=9823 RepID=A0A8D0SY80_PIG